MECTDHLKALSIGKPYAMYKYLFILSQNELSCSSDQNQKKFNIEKEDIEDKNKHFGKSLSNLIITLIFFCNILYLCPYKYLFFKTQKPKDMAQSLAPGMCGKQDLAGKIISFS